MQPPTGRRLQQRLERRFQSFLQLLIADHEATLLVAADQGDFFVGACVQFIQAHEHMAQVDDWIALRVNLVEDVIAEDLQEVPLAVLGPLTIVLVFGSLVDEVQLRHEPDEAAVLEFATQVGGQLVVEVKGGVERRHQCR